MTILLLFAFVVFVVMVGTKEDEAVVLYYDAVVEESMGPDVQSVSGDTPAEAMSITVNGEAINKQEEVQAPVSEDLREVIRARDPVTTHQEAQDIFDMISREGL